MPVRLDFPTCAAPTRLKQLVGVTRWSRWLCRWLRCRILTANSGWRRSSGHWMHAFLPFYAVAAIVVRPFVACLSFLHSLLDIVKSA